MKISKLFVSATLLAAFGTAQADASDSFAFNAPDNSVLSRQMEANRHSREFRGTKSFDTVLSTSAVTSPVRKEKTLTPDLSFTNLPQYDYLEGPDGSTWFYTAEYVIETVEHNPYWTEELITGFTFTIYDSSFNPVGSVQDIVHFAENETRVAEVVVDPAVSAKFFNTDDNLEIMVFFAMNTVQYVNNYYYKVYSVGGEKDSDGNDISLATLEGRCVDATNRAGVGEEEDFYYTFVTDPVYDEDAADKAQSRVDYLNSLTYDLTTYKKATDSEGPTPVLTKSIYSTRVPGDTTDGIYFISKVVDGNLYAIYSQYAKPYFVDPTGGASDESATADNSLKIEVYNLSADQPQLLSTTLIPVENLSTPTELIYSFYSIGSVAWANDVDMSVNGTPSAAAFLVSRDFAKAATLEDVTSSYDIYANNGTLIKNLATDTESIVVFTGNGLTQPQAMFINADENGKYEFSFANLYSAEKLFSIPQANGEDPLTAICSRIVDSEGKVKYVFEMSNPELDLDGREYVRVAWFDDKGQHERIDRIYMGEDAMYATVNVDPEALKPHLFDSDDDMEYAILVKRMFGSGTRNEFMVVDIDGTIVKTFTADDGKGDPFLFSILPGEVNRLMMVYRQNNRFNVDLYDLPFDADKDAVTSITIDTTDGEEVYYDLNGTRMRGDKLPAGIYIKVNGTSATKVIVK